MALAFFRESHFAYLLIGEGGQKQPPFYSDMSCSHIFFEKGLVFLRNNFYSLGLFYVVELLKMGTKNDEACLF